MDEQPDGSRLLILPATNHKTWQDGDLAIPSQFGSRKDTCLNLPQYIYFYFIRQLQLSLAESPALGPPNFMLPVTNWRKTPAVLAYGRLSAGDTS